MIAVLDWNDSSKLMMPVMQLLFFVLAMEKAGLCFGNDIFRYKSLRV